MSLPTVSEQFLRKRWATFDCERTHGAHLVIGAFDDLVFGKARMPFVQTVEVLDGRPDLRHRRLDLDCFHDLQSLRRGGQHGPRSSQSNKCQHGNTSFHVIPHLCEMCATICMIRIRHCTRRCALHAWTSTIYRALIERTGTWLLARPYT